MILAAAIAGENIRDAAIATGLSPKTAGSQASMILKEPQVIKSFQDLLDEVVPNERLTKKYGDLLEATKILSINSTDPDGMIDVPDYPTQLRAADSISKLKGLIVDKQAFEGLKPILLVENAGTTAPTSEL